MDIIRNMARLLWGNPYHGSINRVGYLQGIAIITFIFILSILALVFGIVLLKAFMGGDIQKSQLFLYESMGIPVMVLAGIVFFALFFSNVNLAAKRFRNMGLPGWLMIILFFTVDITLMHFYGKTPSIVFEGLTVLALILIPSSSFDRKNKQNHE